MSNPDHRFLALDCAVRHKTREETAADVVKSAEKYFAFLQGGDLAFAKVPPDILARIKEAADRVKTLPRDQWGEAIAGELDKLPNWEVT